MNKNNKLLSVALALVMCLGTVSPAFAYDYYADVGTVHVSGNESWQDNHETYNESNKYDHVNNNDSEVNITGETDQTVVEVESDASKDIQVNIDNVTANVESGPAADIDGGNVTIENSSLSTQDENSAAVEIGGNADVTVSGGTTTVTGNGTGIEMTGDSSLTVESGGTLEVNGKETTIGNRDNSGTHDIEGSNTGIDMDDNSSLTVENGGALEANGSSVTVNTYNKKNTVNVGGDNTGIDMKGESSVTVEYGGKLEANGSDVVANAALHNYYAGNPVNYSEVNISNGNTGIDMESPDSSLTVNGIADISGGKVTESLTNWADIKADPDGNQALDADSAQVTVGAHGKKSEVAVKAAELASSENFESFTSKNSYDNKTQFFPNIDPHILPDASFKTGAAGNVTNIEIKVGESANIDRQPVRGYEHSCGAQYNYNPTNYAGMSMTLGTSGVVELDGYAAQDTGHYYDALRAMLSGTMPGKTTVELDYYANYTIDKTSGYCSCWKWITLSADYNWYSYQVKANVKVTADYQLSYDLGGGELEEGEKLGPQTRTVASTLGSFGVTGLEPTREGFEFQGWGLKDENGNWIKDKDGNIVTFQGGDSVTLQWEEGRGGTGNPVKGTLCAVWDEVGDPDDNDPDDNDSDDNGPKDDGPKDDNPKDDNPKDDNPKDDGPKDDNPKDDNPRDDDPRDDDPRDDDPRDDDPKDDGPKDDGPKDDGPKDDGPKPEVPKAPGTSNEPSAPPVEEPAVVVSDPEVPQVNIPEEEVPLEEAAEEVVVPDEDVPLANVPKTGDISTLWYLTTLLSACGLALLGLRRKNRS